MTAKLLQIAPKTAPDTRDRDEALAMLDRLRAAVADGKVVAVVALALTDGGEPQQYCFVPAAQKLAAAGGLALLNQSFLADL